MVITGAPRKRLACQKRARGFESHPLRHHYSFLFFFSLPLSPHRRPPRLVRLVLPAYRWPTAALPGSPLGHTGHRRPVPHLGWAGGQRESSFPWSRQPVESAPATARLPSARAARTFAAVLATGASSPASLLLVRGTFSCRLPYPSAATALWGRFRPSARRSACGSSVALAPVVPRPGRRPSPSVPRPSALNALVGWWASPVFPGPAPAARLSRRVPGLPRRLSAWASRVGRRAVPASFFPRAG